MVNRISKSVTIPESGEVVMSSPSNPCSRTQDAILQTAICLLVTLQSEGLHLCSNLFSHLSNIFS